MLHGASIVLLPLTFLVWTACATSYDLVRPPIRDADLYPRAEIRGDIAVAVDEISDPARVNSYFGANLLEKGILPIQVIVSNHGRQRVLIRPSDMLLARGRKVVDPVPLEVVVEIPKDRGLFVTDETAAEIEDFFAELAFRETYVAPGETYQGFIFFRAVSSERPRSRFFRVVSLYLQPRMYLRIVATDPETGERIGFGPFGITAGEAL